MNVDSMSPKEAIIMQLTHRPRLHHVYYSWESRVYGQNCFLLTRQDFKHETTITLELVDYFQDQIQGE